MNNDQKIKFILWLLLKQEPKMLVKSWTPGIFCMIPFTTLERAAYDKDAADNAWMYAFVNQLKKTYKITFTSFDELLDALFDAEEIWYGPTKYKNNLYNKRNEMLIEYDFTNNI